MIAGLARFAFTALLVCAVTHAQAQGFTQGGVTGSYFANATLSGTPSFSRRDVRVRFDWGGLPPGGSTTPSFAAVPASGFSVRWTGTIVAPSTGIFTFTTTTSGPARLWLTSPTGTASEIVAYAGRGRATNTGRYRLMAGKLYGVTMEFQDMAQPAVAELDWAGPGLAQQAIEPAVPLGVNMTSIADWDGSRMFADTIKQSRGWAAPDNFSVPLTADAQGWPTQDFLVIPIAGPPELNGAYALRFQGLAQVQLMFGYGSFSVGPKNYGGTLPSGAGYDAATNTTTAVMNITPTDGINMFMTFTNTRRSRTAKLNTGLTAIQLMRPTAPGADVAYNFQELFNGGLKAALAPFSTVRYMEYLNTNGSTTAHWSDRMLPSVPVQAGPKGGALEYAVMLANETGKDLWINVPVSADKDYVQNLARLLRFGSDGGMPYTLRQLHPVFPPVQPNLNVYVEYSNEVWNFSFSQASTNLSLAEAEVATGVSPLNFDGETNIYYWGWRRVAQRIAQISVIFRAVWGNAAMGTVIRPVLEWQGGDGQATADEQLNFLDDYYNNADGLNHFAVPHPPSYYLWGAGAGWYHTVNDPGAATVDAIYRSGLILPTAVAIDAAWAHSFGLRETGYEGGFEIGNDGPDAIQLAADLDPRAQTFEAAGLKSYFAQGGGLGMIYNIAGASAYGLADPTIYDTATPKMAAVDALVAAAPPRVTLGTPVTGAVSLPTTSADIAHDIWGSFGSTVNVGAGTWLNWTVNVKTPGTYVISTNLGPVDGQAIVVDGATIGNSGSAAALTAGLHGIHVRNLGSGSLALTTLMLTPQ
jgi:hypothetical protein